MGELKDTLDHAVFTYATKIKESIDNGEWSLYTLSVQLEHFALEMRSLRLALKEELQAALSDAIQQDEFDPQSGAWEEVERLRYELEQLEEENDADH